MLKYHANFTSNFFDIFHIIVQLNAVHPNLAVLMALKPV